MFFEQIPVGHSGDVIAHGPMQAFALDPPRRAFAQIPTPSLASAQARVDWLTKPIVGGSRPGIGVRFALIRSDERRN